MEIHVDETLFTLYINPYFLRLNFPGAVLEDDDSSANYDASAGYLTITLTKETKGQDFKDLDLLSKLLAPKSLVDGPAPTPIIEVLHSEVTTNAEADADELSGHMAKLTTVEHELLQGDHHAHIRTSRNVTLLSQLRRMIGNSRRRFQSLNRFSTHLSTNPMVS